MIYNEKVRKFYSLIFLISATCIMPFGMVVFPATMNARTITLYISAIAGYIGIAFLLWLYILGARGVARFFSDDYGTILKIHDFLGRYGILLILLHPIFVTISYGESWLYSFTINFSNSFNFYISLGQFALYILIIIWLISAIIRKMIKYRPWKYIHIVSYIILPLVLLHIPTTGSNYAGSLITRIYFFTIVISFILFTIVRLYSLFNLDKKSYKIIDQTCISSEVYNIRIKPIDDNWLTIIGGQYVYLKDSFFSEDHPFSVLEFDKITGEITIVYKVYGKFTRKLSELKSDTNLFVSGPFGQFTQNININSDSPIIFIAGGIGVTPFYSRLLENNTQQEQWLFYINHCQQTCVLLNDLEKSLGAKLVNLFSEDGNKITKRSQMAKVFRQSLTDHIPNPALCQYYLCGPSQLMKNLEYELTKLGIPKSSISRESFSF